MADCVGYERVTFNVCGGSCGRQRRPQLLFMLGAQVIMRCKACGQCVKPTLELLVVGPDRCWRCGSVTHKTLLEDKGDVKNATRI